MIQNELFYQKRHQPGIKENITTGHLKITLGGSQISIGRKQAKKAAESPRKGYALLFFQMCPKRIIKKEGSPKVRSPEPWGTMELPPGSRNRPTQGIPHALGREPSRLSNKISELICPMMATWLPFFLLPNGRLYPLSVCVLRPGLSPLSFRECLSVFLLSLLIGDEKQLQLPSFEVPNFLDFLFFSQPYWK